MLKVNVTLTNDTSLVFESIFFLLNSTKTLLEVISTDIFLETPSTKRKPSKFQSHWSKTKSAEQPNY